VVRKGQRHAKWLVVQLGSMTTRERGRPGDAVVESSLIVYVLCPFCLQYMLTDKFPACKGLTIKWFHRIILYKILENLGERTLKHKSAKGVNRVGSCVKLQGWV
jgi:hypothetical protein